MNLLLSTFQVFRLVLVFNRTITILILLLIVPIRRSKQTVNITFKRHSASDHLLLYVALSNYDLDPLYKETSVDAAVDRLNAAVTEAMDLAVPFGLIKRKKYPSWFSGKLCPTD
jgi:hypothetical protein